MAQQQGTRKPVPACYVSFRTFLGVLDALRSDMPKRIDRSVFPSFSGSAQSQLIGALRFLGLIDEEGITQPIFDRLVHDEAHRAEILREILEERYAPILEMDLTKATPKQLQEAMQSHYSFRGSTLEKAVSFFLQASVYAGIPVSARLSNRVRGRSGGQALRRTKANRIRSSVGRAAERDTVSASSVPRSQGPQSMRGATKTVSLRSGGTLTLIAEVDVMVLDEIDRQFMFSLIDRLREYEQQAVAPSCDADEVEPLRHHEK